MKKYLTTILMASTLLIGEVHTFWEKKPEVKENWIVNRYEPMSIQWNVKMAGEELILLMYFIAAWFLSLYPNHTNKTTVKVFIFAQLADIALYFWNFKTYNYHILYICMVLLWVWLLRKSIKQRLFG